MTSSPRYRAVAQSLMATSKEQFTITPKKIPVTSTIREDGTFDVFKYTMDQRILGITSAYAPFSTKVSASRNQMVTNQKGQILVVAGARPPKIMHGFETQEAEYCMGEKAPCDMEIISVIPVNLPGSDKFKIKSPILSVVYEDIDTGRAGILDIESHISLHDTFGFEMELTDVARNMQPGDVIKKGTVLSHSNAVKDGVYCAGVELNTLYLSHETSIEDGIGFRRGALDQITPTAIGSISAMCGAEWFPLNLYGDEHHYKPCPDRGEQVRSDGLLLALRKVDPLMDAVNMLPSRLRIPDITTDKLFYISPEAVENGAVVSNIVVIDNENENGKQSVPEEMVGQFKKYARQYSIYHEKLLEIERQLLRNSRIPHSKFEPKLLDKIFQALCDRPNDQNRYIPGSGFKDGRRTRTYRGDRLDEFKIDIQYTYKMKLEEQAKLTDMFGGKGVICEVIEDEDMPYDDDGNVVDCIVFFRGGVARLNPGQFFYHYLTAHFRVVEKCLREMKAANAPLTEMLGYLAGYYEIVSPMQAEILRRMPEDMQKEEIDIVCEDGITLNKLACETHIDSDIVEKCNAYAPMEIKPLNFRDVDGVTKKTKWPALIGSKYMVVLDKSAPKPMAVAVPRLQHHRLPAVPTKSTRHSTPTKNQASRAWGESELQVNSGSAESRDIAEVTDITTNPRSTEEAVYSISIADNPANIEVAVNRETHPINKGSPQSFMYSLLSGYGIGLYKEKEDEV